MEKKLTLLLCLKDRSEYTESWIENNICEDYEYIIADGSKNDKNFIIFNKIKFQNVKYFKYAYDKDIKTYIEKVIDALKKVTTPYVMRVDNDDIVIKKGLKTMIAALEKNSQYGIAQANIRGIFMKNSTLKNPKYSVVPGIKENFSDLVDLNGLNAIEQVLNPYRQIWYGVYKTSIYKKVWCDISESKLDNIFLIEYLQAQLALIHSKMIYLNETYYLRLSNPTSSTTLNNQTNQYPDWQRIYFDEEYRNEVDKMASCISDKLNCDKGKLYDVYRKMFSSFDSRNDRLRIVALKIIKLLISRLFLSLIPYVNGKKLKSISSFLNCMN